MIDPVRVAQNSNSVSDTLTKAMGLQYPAETENLWAPGHGRVLLPEGFQSVFDASRLKPGWLETPSAQTYLDSVVSGLDQLNNGHVSA